MSDLNIIPQKIIDSEEWLLQLAEVITDINELMTLLDLDIKTIDQYDKQIKNGFPLRVSRQFIQRIEKGNPTDPLLRQVMIVPEEQQTKKGYSYDPLQEKTYNVTTNLLHKYHNRVLLMTKNSCAINCRYCFRRHFPYQQNAGNKHNWQVALDYIKNHPQINEVILSGGDPLMAKDHELNWLISQIEAITSVKTLRIHTRLAVVIPARITDFLVFRFMQSRLNIVIVTHINHCNEIDVQVKNSMLKLKTANVTLLNQSVLLKGVNDETQTLIDLSLTLFNAGILPYYLHLLDKVQGAAHYYVPLTKAKQLMREVSSQVSGYLLPKLVRETSGKKSKTLIYY